MQQQREKVSATRVGVTPLTLTYVIQKFEKDFYYALHRLEGGSDDSAARELILDVPKMDQERLNYVKFGHILGALGYISLSS